RDGGEPGADDDHGEAGPHPDVGDDDRRRDQLRAEPRDAAVRRGEGRRRDADFVAGAGDAVERKRAVVVRLRALHLLPGGVVERKRDAGETELLVLDLAGLAAAGREVAPDDALD